MEKVLNIQQAQSDLPKLATYVAKGRGVRILNDTQKMLFIDKDPKKILKINLLPVLFIQFQGVNLLWRSHVCLVAINNVDIDKIQG